MIGMTLTVAPGIDMTRALGSERLSKQWLRDYLRKNPEKDFRNLSGGGTYVNGGDAVRMDLTLQVVSMRNPATVIAVVNYQRDAHTDWGYQAVVQ